MDRVAGIEIEYGCLVAKDQPPAHVDAWPARVKTHIFKKLALGLIDLHYRDYEEPPGNGGFLFNGGRLYLDMGHLEYSSPECVSLRDAVAYEQAGDQIILKALEDMEVRSQVSFLKNNIDHFTGATFGCHENYLMRREANFSDGALGALLCFLATRQIFTGAGRVGQTDPLTFDYEAADFGAPVRFQMSQRADHIVNDIYQWVQFNRSIINARDEPLADYRKYRRLHLLIGDSNMSPFATALKIGTTSLVLDMLEDGRLPGGCELRDAVSATRHLSRDVEGDWQVEMASGRTIGALDLQYRFLEEARKCFGGRDEETDWVLENWAFTLDVMRSKPEALLGGVDWISKKWLLEMFAEEEGLDWSSPHMLSLDLEYHNIDPDRGLFFSLEGAKGIGDFNAASRRLETISSPPRNTRAAGRSDALRRIRERGLGYLVNWDAIALEDKRHFPMPDPFETYLEKAREFVAGECD
ncbi:MAG TPA: proteasome accessory factor PafA2 family protein [Chthoniobacterales bacterium]